jgi:hypothetical protein
MQAMSSKFKEMGGNVYVDAEVAKADATKASNKGLG